MCACVKIVIRWVIPFLKLGLYQAKDLTTVPVRTQRLMFTVAEAIRRANRKLPITYNAHVIVIFIITHVSLFANFLKHLIKVSTKELEDQPKERPYLIGGRSLACQQGISLVLAKTPIIQLRGAVAYFLYIVVYRLRPVSVAFFLLLILLSVNRAYLMNHSTDFYETLSQ